MSYKHWTIDELPWDMLDSSKVGADLLKVIKAAALVEYNAETYADYLCRVFKGDETFSSDARAWAVEEVQHGKALGAWAEKIDPSWSLERAMARFRKGYAPEHFLATNESASVRGSRAGELISRCMVETGTSSYYTAIGHSTEEPVLKEICIKIAADEFRHYKLFYDHLNRYVERDKLGTVSRLKVALGRIAETEDDELSYAFYAANASEGTPYDRKTFNQEYMRRAYSYYQAPQVDRAVAMIFKACGLSPQSIMHKAASKAAWWMIQRNIRGAEKTGMLAQKEAA